MPTLFRPYEPNQQFLLPPSLLEWLPSDHLVWFISETIDQLDLDAIIDVYRESGQGNLPYHPAMMLKLLIYAYSSGVFSSRGIARQVEENVAFRVLAAGHRPDHRTICRFRERHLDAFEGLFVQVVQIARDTGLVKMGVLAIDGSKVHANASKRKAMSYERMKQDEKRLRKEIRALTNRASKRDSVEDVQFGPDFRGDQLPQELQRREERLAKIVAAKKRLEARKQEASAAAERNRDEDDPPKPRRAPKHPPGTPKPKDQENFTDPQSRIMKDGTGAFQQCYNTSVAVDGTSRIIVANDVHESASDAPQLLPMVDEAKRNVRMKPRIVLADAGYASEENLRGLERRRIDGYVALGREGKKPRPPRADAHATKRMGAKLKTKRGRKRYKKRKHIAEPPFGWMKRILGFRQFSLRGQRKVAGEFDLICVALNLRRMGSMIRWT